MDAWLGPSHGVLLLGVVICVGILVVQKARANRHNRPRADQPSRYSEADVAKAMEAIELIDEGLEELDVRRQTPQVRELLDARRRYGIILEDAGYTVPAPLIYW